MTRAENSSIFISTAVVLLFLEHYGNEYH